MTRSVPPIRSSNPTASITTSTPGTQPRAGEGQKAEPQSTGGARAGLVRTIDAEIVFGDGGQMSEGTIEQEHVVGPRPLLRSEHRARAGRSAQRVVHVGDGDDLDRTHGVQHRADVDRGQLQQRAAAVRHVVALPVEEPAAERDGHPDAAVVRGGPAETHQERGHPLRKDRGHQFPGAAGRRVHGIAMIGPHEVEAGGPGHLDHPDPVADARLGLDRAAERAGHAAPQAPAGIRRHERVQRSLAASASGTRSSTSSGRSRSQPDSIASAAWRAVSVPRNLSGATRTRMAATVQSRPNRPGKARAT